MLKRTDPARDPSPIHEHANPCPALLLLPCLPSLPSRVAGECTWIARESPALI
jgi:hypothetical protein